MAEDRGEHDQRREQDRERGHLAMIPVQRRGHEPLVRRREVATEPVGLVREPAHVAEQQITRLLRVAVVVERDGLLALGIVVPVDRGELAKDVALLVGARAPPRVGEPAGQLGLDLVQVVHPGHSPLVQHVRRHEAALLEEGGLELGRGHDTGHVLGDHRAHVPLHLASGEPRAEAARDRHDEHGADERDHARARAESHQATSGRP
jgi:hypothetical protein